MFNLNDNTSDNLVTKHNYIYDWVQDNQEDLLKQFNDNLLVYQREPSDYYKRQYHMGPYRFHWDSDLKIRDSYLLRRILFYKCNENAHFFIPTTERHILDASIRDTIKIKDMIDEPYAISIELAKDLDLKYYINVHVSNACNIEALNENLLFVK